MCNHTNINEWYSKINNKSYKSNIVCQSMCKCYKIK